MTKRRMISEDFFQSEGVIDWTMRQRLLVLGIIANADDQGRIRGHPKWLKSRIFPYDDFTPKDIEDDLQAIAAGNDTILLYKAKGKRCIQLVNWWEYQSLQWAKPSDLPAPDDWTDRIRMMMYEPKRWVMTLNWFDVKDNTTYKVMVSGNEPPIFNINTNTKIKTIDINKELPRFLEMWKFYFPDKPQPRKPYKKVKAKLSARLKDDYFVLNYEKALEKASTSEFVKGGGWFDALWFLHNEENWEKCLNGKYKNDKIPAFPGTPPPPRHYAEIGERGRIKKNARY